MISVTRLSTSPTRDTTASTSPAARGRARPATPGTTVNTVLLTAPMMLLKELWTVGTIEEVTSDATVEAASGQ